MPQPVEARTLKSWLADGEEIALLDCRELGPYSEGHPLFAVPLPYSRLECDLERLVPRTSVRLVFLDQQGEGLALMAAKRAEALGYTGVHTLAGGAAGWSQAGYRLYSGVNVPSKVFGELVELARHTPRITAADLDRMRRNGERHVIVDGRTWAEYQRFSIPGGISCPNGELALRIGGIVPDDQTTIVVNCAGRTRSIIGAQTLIDFGIPNQVVALENGTQGWFLAGFTPERGAARRYPGPATGDDLARRQARARDLMGERGIRSVTASVAAGWLADPSRTTYLLDVRTPEEHRADGLAGSLSAEGGQLIQATDQWIGVRGARLVLIDSDGVRAPLVASWLVQLGHDAVVLEGGIRSGLDAPHRAPSSEARLPQLRKIGARELAAGLESGTMAAIDLRPSAAYRKGHVPGAVWSIRPRIVAAAKALGAERRTVVLIADEGRVARAAAIDLAEAGIADVVRLRGGIEDWIADGLSLAASPDVPADSDRIDFVFHTHRRHDGSVEDAKAYLAWEVDLVNQLDADERRSFKVWGGR